ncbi:MAG: hypothetical protein RIG62_14315 [Cyclobacteriaceae bacterium]
MKLDSEISILEAAQLVIYSMEQEETIRQQMEAYGFTPNRMQQGKGLLTKSRHCQKEQSERYNAQWELTQQLQAEMDMIIPLFKEHAKVTKVAFRSEPNTVHSLKIDRLERKGWPAVRQAEHFYAKLLELDLNLEHYGISKKEIQQNRTAIKALQTMKEERMRIKALAENCTQTKQESLQRLRSWVIEFRSMARIAFKQTPQMLEAFGIPVIA